MMRINAALRTAAVLGVCAHICDASRNSDGSLRPFEFMIRWPNGYGLGMV